MWKISLRQGAMNGGVVWCSIREGRMTVGMREDTIMRPLSLSPYSLGSDSEGICVWCMRERVKQEKKKKE